MRRLTSYLRGQFDEDAWLRKMGESIELGRPTSFLRSFTTEPEIVGAAAKVVPRDLRVFHDPMLLDGEIFFRLRPERAQLSTWLPLIVGAFQGVRDHVDEVISHLRTFPCLAAFDADVSEQYLLALRLDGAPRGSIAPAA